MKTVYQPGTSCILEDHGSKENILQASENVHIHILENLGIVTETSCNQPG